MRVKRKLILFSCVMLLLPLIAGATTLRGSFSGNVRDDNGEPLPGVVVKCTSPVLQNPRYYTTDENGYYRLIELPPGTGYQMEYKMMGFQTIIRTDLVVKVNKDFEVNVVMKEQAFEEEVVISGAAPVLDTSSATTGVNLDRDFTERLPGSDQYQTALSLQGGTTGGGDGNARIHGSMGNQNLYLFDGVDTTDPTTGTFGANLNADAVAETEVLTGGMPAEYGRVSGGVINTITKSGGNDFSGSIRIKYFNSDWAGDSDFYEEGPSNEFWEPTISIGGPILKDKLWFFFAYSRSDRDATAVTRHFDFDGNVTEYTWDTSQLWQDYAAKLTFSLSPDHQLVFTWSSDPMTQDNQNATAADISSESLTSWEQGGDQYGLNYTWIVNQNFFIEAKLGISRQMLNDIPNSTEPQFTVNFPNGHTEEQGGNGFYDENNRNRDSADLSAKYFSNDLWGTHDIKLGFSYSKLESDEARYVTPTLEEGVTYDIELDENGNWTENSTMTMFLHQAPGTRTAFYYAAFIQDKWKPDFLEGLTINYGLRAESNRGENNIGDEIYKFGFGDMLAPRIGLVWDIGNTGKHKISAYYGRFYTTLPVAFLSMFQVDDSETWTYDWNPDVQDWELRNIVYNAAIPNQIDPDIKPPYDDQYILTYEREITDDWSAGISYTIKRTRDLVEDYGIWLDEDGNQIWPGPPNTDYTLYDTDVYTNYYMVANIPGSKRDYKSLELYTNARLKNLTLMASYTWADLKGTTLETMEGNAGTVSYFTGLYDTPGASQNLYRTLPYDITHYVKLNAAYQFSWGTSIGMRAFWRSGYHYTKWQRDERVPGPAGTNYYYQNWYHCSGETFELPSYYQIDMSLQQDIDFGRYGVLTFIFDVFNVTDNQSILGEERNDNANFGQANVWSNPIQWQAQVRYSF